MSLHPPLPRTLSFLKEMWTYEWKRKGGGRIKATESCLQFRCEAESSSMSAESVKTTENQRELASVQHMWRTQNTSSQFTPKNAKRTHSLVTSSWLFQALLKLVFFICVILNFKVSAFAIFSRPTQNLFLCVKKLLFLQFYKSFILFMFIQISLLFICKFKGLLKCLNLSTTFWCSTLNVGATFFDLE